MTKIEEIEARLAQLEDRMDTCIVVLNKLIDDVFEPEFVKKTDKLVEYGEKSGE